jgi:hypothetical protein
MNRWDAEWPERPDDGVTSPAEFGRRYERKQKIAVAGEVKGSDMSDDGPTRQSR